jgi:hypothetical protein
MFLTREGCKEHTVPDISHLVIKIDSNGVVQASGNFGKFVEASEKAKKTATTLEKSMGGLGNNFAAFSLITNKLPGPLKSVASGMMGMVSPATAAASAIIELANSMGQFVSEGYALYQEQEVQIARFGAVLQSTGAEAWTTAGQLESFAASLQAVTGRSSNEIMQMQSVLLGFTSITGETFNRLTEGMINMADVMGGSLVGSANAFGKAMDTPAESISALTRYGFKFTAEQKNMIKALEDAGRHAEAQAVILNSMEQAFGNAAEATREAKSATTDYELAVYNLKKAIGEEFKPAIDAATELFTKPIKYFGDLIQLVNDFNKARSYLAKEDKNDNSVDATINRLKAQEAIAKYMLTTWGLSEEAQKGYLAQLNDINIALEKQYGIQKRIADETANDPLKKIKDMYANLGEDYKNTPEGSEKETQRIIMLYRRMKTELEDVSDYEKHMIDEIIKMYEEKQKKIKTELLDWQELLKTTLHISDEAALSGITALEEYTTGFYDRLGGALSYAQIAGEDAAEAYGEFADEIDRAMKALMYSGKFNTTDNAIQGLSDLLAKISELAKVQQKINIRKILGLDKGNDEQAFEEYLFGFQTRLNKLMAASDLSILTSMPYDASLPEEGNGIHDVGYTAGAKRIKDYMSATGIELDQFYEDEEQRMRAVIDELFLAGVSIPEDILEGYKELKETVDGNAQLRRGTEYLGTLKAELDLEKQLAAGEITREQYAIKRLEAEKQISEAAAKSAYAMIQETNGTAKITGLQEQLNLEEQLLNREITREEYAIKRLAAEQNISYESAKQAYELQNQIDDIQLLRDVMSQLGEELLRNGISGTIDMMHELGQAFQDGAIASDEMSDALKNMVKSIIDSLPQLFLSAGLQLLIKGNWKVGLAFIAASGLSAFVSGLISDSSNDDKSREQLEELRRLQDEITKLIEQQKEQSEYYLLKRRELNAGAAIGNYNVNDMILTPDGTFSTHPDDYIIATKHPENMVQGNMQVNVKVVNNANANVTTTQGVGADGLPELLVMIDQRVQGNIASGKYDNSFSARDRRKAGRNLST